MRRHLVNALKLLLVAGLMAFVASTVQWDDTYIVTRGKTEQRHPGKILGAWDQPTVEFRRDDTGAVETIEPGERADGTTVVVSPGFTTHVRYLNLWLFLAGAACYAASVTFAAVRWWWLMKMNSLQVTPWDALRFTWIGLFFNNVIPGQTGGDVVKALYIVKHCHGARMPALVSVLVDRILGLGSLALLGGVVVLFALDKADFVTLAIGIWAVLAAVTLLGVIAFSKRIRRLVQLDDLLNKLPAKLSSLLKHVDRAVFFYRGHKVGICIWIIAGMGNHAVSVLSVMLIGKALGVGMPAYEYFVLVPVITIASAFPLAPNGWGFGEALYRFLFGTYGAAHLAAAQGVPASTASFIMGTRGVALSVVFRIHLTLWSLLGGLLVLLEKDRVTREDIQEEVALEAEEAL